MAANPRIFNLIGKYFFQSCIYWFVLTISSTSFSQIQNSISTIPAEKIYLQLDGKVFTNDQTIWFKSVVVNADDHKPSKRSGVLYVEIIGPDEVQKDFKIIKIDNGIGSGFFQLTKSYSEGVYLIRAYTKWNMNFEDDFIFKEYIRIFPSDPVQQQEFIHDITLVEKNKNELLLHAILDPMAIDSLHEGKLIVDLVIDNQKDSVVIKKDRDEKYLLEYPIADTSKLLTIQIETKNSYKQSKTIVLDEQYIDLQFFPESGTLVHGLASKVGFKAVDYKGNGKMVEGDILNENNEVIVSFQSDELGMGAFILDRADTSHRYFARIKDLPNTKVVLPETKTFGNKLTVTTDKEEFLLVAESNYLKNHRVFIRIVCRGVLYYEIEGRLKNGKLSYTIPRTSLPEGVISFTLMDDIKYPVAERLAFNMRSETHIRLELETDKTNYEQREETKLSIRIKDSLGKFAKANMSVLVINKSQLGAIQDSRQNILSYFLLNSDLRGEIEHPSYYFTDNGINIAQMDALMLTQGWRKYKYGRTISDFQFQPEYYLAVSGEVGGVLSKKSRKKNIELTMMTLDKERKVQAQLTDSAGRFSFDIHDSYGESLNIMIQSANKKGKNTDYHITLDVPISPDIVYDHRKSMESVDSVIYSLVDQNIERKEVEDAFRLSTGVILLDEVIIEDLNDIPARKMMIEKHGEPDLIIRGEEIRAKEEKWSFGLWSILQYNFPGKINFLRNRQGVLIPYVGNGRDWTIYTVDGIPVTNLNYINVIRMPIDEIKSLEIIENAKDFYNICRKAFPELSPEKIPSQGNIIAIYTKRGEGPSGIQETIGLLHTSVAVFSPEREFYSPKYKNLTSEDWIKPDLRALIHWEPNIQTNESDGATAIFYNADNKGEILIIVEAINEKGEIGYEELIYEVE